MICMWYLAIIPRVIFENFEILRDGIIDKYHVQVMLFFVSNRRRECKRDLHFVTG